MKRTRAEIKYLETNHIENIFLTDEGDNYLVEPYMLQYDNEGKLFPHYYSHGPYILSKELEGSKYIVYLQEEEINMKSKFNFTHLHANLHDNKYGAYQEKIFEEDLNNALQNDYHLNEKQARIVINYSKRICEDKNWEIDAQTLTAVAEDFGYTAKNIIHAK